MTRVTCHETRVIPSSEDCEGSRADERGLLRIGGSLALCGARDDTAAPSAVEPQLSVVSVFSVVIPRSGVERLEPQRTQRTPRTEIEFESGRKAERCHSARTRAILIGCPGS